MQTNPTPEQWALDLLTDIIDIGGLGGPCSEADCVECGKVALKIQAAFAEREARLVGQWVFPKSINDMPKKPGKEAYEYVECLVMHKGDMIARPWNCEYQVFDDEAQDDFFCEWHEVTAYIDLTEARTTFAALKDRTHD